MDICMLWVIIGVYFVYVSRIIIGVFISVCIIV